MLSIRQITDPVLHKKPYTIDFNNPEHVNQLHLALPIMRKSLYEFNGVGIAANQCRECENPAQIIIVGNNQPALAQQRYPDRVIPNEIVMINPELIDWNQPYYPESGEGCLSVKSALRARVKRYQNITLEYFDVQGTYQVKSFEGFIAHIIQHEYDHLQGIVYLQKALNELNRQQTEQMLAILEQPTPQSTTGLSPIVVIDRDPDNQPSLDVTQLKLALSQTHPLALEGIKHLLHQNLKKI